ncbi:FAD synthase [archaeon]|nr:FAD synthase [archaeon]
MKILVFGTYDIFHKGHEYFLNESAKLGSLNVVVARDLTTYEVKGMFPRHDQLKRVKVLQELPYVDNVFLGNEGDKYKIIEEIKPDVICLGYDQESFTKGLKEELEKRGLNVKINRIGSLKPEVYKSSVIREKSR